MCSVARPDLCSAGLHQCSSHHAQNTSLIVHPLPLPPLPLSTLITHRQLAYEQKLVKLEMSMAKNAAEGAGMPADALDALEAAVNHNLDLLHQTLNDKIMELQEARKVGRRGGAGARWRLWRA